MSITKEQIKGIKYELSFELTGEDFESRLKGMLEKFASTHKEKGFRQGHVPMDVIRSKYEQHFIGDVMNELIGETMSAYFKDKGINPVASPSISVDSFVRGGAFKFSAQFDILPKIKDIDLSKIMIEKPVAKASDKDVDEAIQNIASSRHSSEEVKENRKAVKGDIAIIDFEGFVDGKAFEGGKGSDHRLELGSGAFIPGFEDKLIGKTKGPHEINVTFPKDYGHAALAGKQALFKVELKGLRKKIVPEINDEFARELQRESLADLKKYVRELLEKNYMNAAVSVMKDRLLDELTKEKIDLPESLVEREAEYLLGEHARHRQTEPDEKEAKKEKEEFRSQAQRRVKLGLIVAHIGTREKIEVSEDDIQQALLKETMRYPSEQASQIFDYYAKNKSAKESLKAGLFEEKVIDFILSKTKVKEKPVSAKELMKRK